MRTLLAIMASLMMMSASAQSSRPRVSVPMRQPQSVSMTQVQAQQLSLQLRSPGDASVAKPRSTGEIQPYYHRPAGAFYATTFVKDGTFYGSLNDGVLLVKPYTDYTFHGQAHGADLQDAYWWDYAASGETHHVNSPYLTVNYGIETNDVPTLSVYQNGDASQAYVYHYPAVTGTGTVVSPFDPWPSGDAEPTAGDLNPTVIYSVPTSMMMSYEGEEMLLSSKTVCQSMMNGNTPPYIFTSGAPVPLGNDFGWWFGKNGCHDLDDPSFFVDGIAQAFEKPSAPYLLKQVAMKCAILDVKGPVDMDCRIYKLDEIPPYQADECAVLPLEPGELIATGHAHLTPETNDETGGLVLFTLCDEEDGLEFEITPTIDCAILVVVDGYNDPEMANLVDFTALVASNGEMDEGFGELAYLKFGRPGDNGQVDYNWVGLNNFFASGTMMTGFSVFLMADMPYLVLKDRDEYAELLIPVEGGSSQVEFLSWFPSEDDDWSVTCQGQEPPEWLDIRLTDVIEYGEWNGVVNAQVVAEPLPNGVTYREAVVRFETPGAYLDYKFIQGVETWPPYDPCGYFDDGEANIADVNRLIDYLLNDMYDDCWDLNQDGELNIADLNILIDIILNLNRN